MGAAPTTMVAVAEAQLVGCTASHTVYGILYVPAGVPGLTVIVPSGLSVKPPVDGVGVVLPQVNVTLPLPVPLVGPFALPSVSLTSTLPSEPPAAPLGTV